MHARMRNWLAVTALVAVCAAHAEDAVPLSAEAKQQLATAVTAMAAREKALASLSGTLREEVWSSRMGYQVSRMDPRLDVKENAEGVAHRSQFVVRFVLKGDDLRYDSLALAGGANPWYNLDRFEAGITHGGPVVISPLVSADGSWPLCVRILKGRTERDYDSDRHSLDLKQREDYTPLSGSAVAARLMLARTFITPWSRTVAAILEREGATRLAGAAAEPPRRGGSVLLRQPDEQTDDGRCIRLQWIVRNEKAFLKWQFWIAPDLGYAVVRHTEDGCDAQTNNGRITVKQASGFQKVADGVWLPRHTEEHVWVYNETRKPVWLSSQLTRFEELEADHVEDRAFDFEPPLGTQVSDHITGQGAFWGISRMPVLPLSDSVPVRPDLAATGALLPPD